MDLQKQLNRNGITKKKKIKQIFKENYVDYIEQDRMVSRERPKTGRLGSGYQKKGLAVAYKNRANKKEDRY